MGNQPIDLFRRQLGGIQHFVGHLGQHAHGELEDGLAVLVGAGSSGRAGPVFAVAVSPSQQEVASAGRDKTVQVWQPAQVRPFDFDELGARIRSARLTPTSPIGELPRQLPIPEHRLLIGHTAEVRAVEFSADGQRVLDACAAPGGKTCHVLERVDGPCSVTALDVSEARLGRVRESLARLGLEAEVLAGDAGDPGGWWDGRPYDRILLDVPCSATARAAASQTVSTSWPSTIS